MEKGKRQKGKEQYVDVGIDIISSLPENVLHHILSFLSTKDAIRTSILSRKWEYLWTSISNIELDDRFLLCKKEDPSFFLKFVERVLLLHDASDIKRLSLEISVHVDSCHLNSWISAAIRHNVKELDLSLFPPVKTQFALPCCLFTCQSLVVLHLLMDCALKVPSQIHFSNLKTLKLWHVTFSDDNSTQQLFSSCPALQELFLSNCGWQNIKALTISIPTLKILTIYDNGSSEQDMLSCVTQIFAPNLISLTLMSGLFVDFHLCDLSSIVDASICLDPAKPVVVYDPQVLGIFTGIHSVKKLSTTSPTLESLMFAENLLDRLPTFYNMIHLELDSEFSSASTEVMMDLLEKSPKLELLQFDEGFDPDDVDVLLLERVPSCFESSLKTVCIKYFDEKPVEMQLIKFLLKHATVLERMMLYSYSDDMYEKQRRVRNHLNKLPRGSETCVIQLRST